LDFLKKIYPLIIIFPLFSAIAMVVFGRKRGFSYAKIYSGFFMFVTLCLSFHAFYHVGLQASPKTLGGAF